MAGPSGSGKTLIANKLAEVKEKPVEEIYRQVRENTRRCYGI